MSSTEPPVGPSQPVSAAAGEPVDASPPPTPSRPRRHRGWRWTGASLLLLIAALLATISVVARYARDEIINTDTYVATVTPLASDPAVQDAVTNRATDEIIAKIDIPKLINDLANATGRPNAPAIASVIAGPVTNYVQDLVHGKVREFVRSPQFEELWINANTTAHTQLSGVLTGNGTDVVTTQGDQIILQLGPIVAQVKQRLVDSGFSVASSIPAVSLQVPVMTVQNLPRIQSYVRLLDNVATWLPLAALVLLALGIWLAPGHRRAALIGAAMIVVLMAVLLIALNAFRGTYENQVANRNLNVAAALSLYDTLLRYLVNAIEALLIVAAIAVIWLWLAGPGRVGRFLRHWGMRGEQFLADRLDRANVRFGPVPRFLRRFGTAIIIVAGVLAAFGLLSSPTIAVAVWLSVGMVMLMLVVGMLARIGSPATPKAVATPSGPR